MVLRSISFEQLQFMKLETKEANELIGKILSDDYTDVFDRAILLKLPRKERYKVFLDYFHTRIEQYFELGYRQLSLHGPYYAGYSKERRKEEVKQIRRSLRFCMYFGNWEEPNKCIKKTASIHTIRFFMHLGNLVFLSKEQTEMV